MNEGRLPAFHTTVVRMMIRQIVFTVWLLVFSVAAAEAATADLRTYVMRYKDVTLSRDALTKILQYEYLVDYFTGFYYFSSRQKVSPEFVKALILAESGADPGAVSSKDALGLGQILLSTGRQAGRVLARSGASFRYVSKETLGDLERNDLFDPATNILITCYLIAKYNYRFDGRLDLVLSAWNAGENNGSLSRLQHAPYRETRNLIGKVNGYYLFLLREKEALTE